MAITDQNQGYSVDEKFHLTVVSHRGVLSIDKCMHDEPLQLTLYIIQAGWLASLAPLLHSIVVSLHEENPQ